MRKLLIVGFLCAVWIMTVFDIGSAQNRRQRMQADWSFWKGPDIGSVIGDFERVTYDGDSFKLSDKRGKILVLEMGACT